MDKRLLNFMLVSMLLFIGYMELMKFMAPPPELDEEGNPVAQQLVDDDVETGDPIVADDELAQIADNTNNAEGQAEAVFDESESADDVDRPTTTERFTIGSIDPQSGYSMLVTFINRGAAIERVELSDPTYRDLEDRTAYIGHLGLEPADGGVRVTCVGDGTPAALAGIQVGDIITSVGDESTGNDEAYELARQKFQRGDTVPVTIRRDGTSQNLTLTSIRRPLEVVRPEQMPNGENQLQQFSYLLTLNRVGQRTANYGEDEIAKLPSLLNGYWLAESTSENGRTVVEFRFPLSSADLKNIGVDGELEVVKRFSLGPTPAPADENEPRDHRTYHFDFDLEFINKGENNLELGYRIDGPTGLPLEGWWYSYKTHPTSFAGAGMRDVIWRPADEGHQFYTNPMVTKQLKKWKKNKDENARNLIIVDNEQPKKLQYAGVDAQYFTSALLAKASPDAASIILDHVDARALSDVDELRASRTPITFRADTSTVLVPSQKSLTHEFEIFAGPKHPDVLTQYELDECIVYGWFSAPAKFMGWLLHGFHYIVGSYGIAIILLTILVRACMFPIGRQQAENARKMQELTPEIKKIKEKYPNDTEKQAKAQQELFRKHNYNPVAGCLPMFLQLPIFIGLYRALSVDIELRQTPLIPGVEWCSNLASPDMLFRWDSMIPFEAITGYAGYLGPFFNLLPVISTGFFLVHQQIFTPPPTDEQQEMQQKVMKFMMLFMLVLFFKVPAGLCLYFITSSAWALTERLLLPKNTGNKTEQTPIKLQEVSADADDNSNGNAANTAAAVAKKKRRKKNKK